ncbi:replication initiator protein A (plasmid) [Deinococcus taeanensis]|uniref:replication initiator protein A n=1 Tax=Deinococcus taeanensis TaxID=2737050 RepID=UPI001CDD6E65|nr:replication initiator protein A [Deinococcus taeanensis]UBV45547.1 replication initiator protein A [Deinococcus taeanensis]
MLSSSEERNLNRLSLVLAASRIPDTMTSWTRSWSSADHLGITVNVSCVASANDVVPHGIDNDILFGLTNAYIGAGMPQDNTFRVTAYQLLVYAALPIGGHSYAAIKPSLTRLRNSTYTITDSWYDRKDETYQSLSTSLIQNWKVIERRRAPTHFEEEFLTAEALFQVTLDPDLARSIRLGYIRPVDLNILRNLNQPLTRTLYRKLEDEKNPVDRPQQLVYQTALLPWAERLGINGRPDTIRRALHAPHQQLLDSGFLADVSYIGRGKEQDVQYVFAQTTTSPARPEAVAALTSRRITQGAALKYASEYGLEAVKEAVRTYDALIAGGYRAKNTSGLLVDILRNPLKYAVTEETTVQKPSSPARTKAPAEPLLAAPEDEERSVQTAWFILRKIMLPEALKDTATELYLRGLVTAAELAALKQDSQPAQTVLLWGNRQGSPGTTDLVD